MVKKKKPKTVHRKKLFGGIQTAQEVHWSAFPGVRCECGLAPAVRAIAFAMLSDMLEKDPLHLRYLADSNGGEIPTVQFKYGTFVKTGEVYSCNICRPAMEKAMAKLPSWVLVEIDAGPSPDRPIVQVG